MNRIATLLFAAMAVMPQAARADNAFMGHYGYMLTMPNDYTAKPKFSGELEVADMYPETCIGLRGRMECAKIGMVELYVLPKRIVDKEVGKKGLDAYVSMITTDATKAGLKTRVTRDKRAGFPAALITMPGHPQPLNTMLLIEGSKVYYRFKYNDKTGAKVAKAIAASLKEIAPHDNPPEPGAQ